MLFSEFALRMQMKRKKCNLIRLKCINNKTSQEGFMLILNLLNRTKLPALTLFGSVSLMTEQTVELNSHF